MLDTETDNVVVLDDSELSFIADGGVVVKPGTYERNAFVRGEDAAGFTDHGSKQTRYIYETGRERLRDGEVLSYGSGVSKLEVIHEDYAGTPKSDDVVAEWLFDQFVESEGERRALALETLHKLGYDVESDTEYELVEP